MTAPPIAASTTAFAVTSGSPTPITDLHNAPVGMTLLNRGDNGGTVLIQPGPAGAAAAVPLGPAATLTWTDPAQLPYASLAPGSAGPETLVLTSQSSAYTNPTVIAAATAASIAAQGIPALFTSTGVYSGTIAAGASSPMLDVSNFASLNLFSTFAVGGLPLAALTTFDLPDGSAWPSKDWTTGTSGTTAGSAAPAGSKVDVQGSQGRFLMTGQGYAQARVTTTTEIYYDIVGDFTRPTGNTAAQIIQWYVAATPVNTSTFPYGPAMKTAVVFSWQLDTQQIYAFQNTYPNSTPTSTIIGPNPPPTTPFLEGTTQRIRVQFTLTGSTQYFRLKVWDPAASEPTAWLREITPPVVQVAGGCSVGIQGLTGTGAILVDNLSVTSPTKMAVGSVQAKFTDPAVSAAPTGGPWLSLDPTWAPGESCFVSAPVIAPRMTLVNNGTAAATVTVAGTTRTAANGMVRQNGDEVGIRQLAATNVAASATATLTSAAGSSLTRMNGHCQVILTAGTGTLYANYVDEGGNTITQKVATAAGTFDYMHPSVPVRWTYANSTAVQTVTLTVSAAN